MRQRYTAILGSSLVCVMVFATCTNLLLDEFDNPVDPEAEAYQGYDTVDSIDDIQLHIEEGEDLAWPTFVVSRVTGADSYDVQIAESEDFGPESIVYDGSGYATNLMRPAFDPEDPEVVAGETYYWRARAVESGAAGLWTEPRSFQPYGVLGMTPEDGSFVSTERPTVSWEPVEDVTDYVIVFGVTEDGSFAEDDLVGSVVDGDQTSVVPPADINPGQTGIWMMVAIDGDDHGPWSPIYTVYRPDIGSTGPAGGAIFYIDDEDAFDWTFLEAAPEETEWAFEFWGGMGTFAGGTSTALGTGEDNTAAIVQEYGTHEPLYGDSDYAARLAQNLEHNGYDDWYLPSREELRLIRDNLYAEGIGGFGAPRYWSSSEYDDERAWTHWFGNDSQDPSDKWLNTSVRAIRSF